MRIVIISDTHGSHDKVQVPDGDVLLHAGDCSMRGDSAEIAAFNSWLGTLPHPHKLFVAGNHDFFFQDYPEQADTALSNATYLQDKTVEIDGIKFYGTAWQPDFHNWAFNLPRGPQLAAKWAMIPSDTDVLITHTPPHKILDRTFMFQAVGCKDLAAAVAALNLRLHVFGHIHEAYGQVTRNGTQFINASINTLRYRPTNKPVVIEL